MRTAVLGSGPLATVPCTIQDARAFVRQHHRHHKPPVSGLFAIGAATGGVIMPGGAFGPGRQAMTVRGRSILLSGERARLVGVLEARSRSIVLGAILDPDIPDLWDTGPYVCPGCYAVGGEPCAADCIDAEIDRARREDRNYDPDEDYPARGWDEDS
jgi:hypothetical protein